MLQTEYDLSSPVSEAAQSEPTEAVQTNSDVAKNDQPQPERERVRLLVYGSRRAIERTIVQLHLLGYVEPFRWNPIAPIPENGITITPAEAESYSFLMKELRIG